MDPVADAAGSIFVTSFAAIRRNLRRTAFAPRTNRVSTAPDRRGTEILTYEITGSGPSVVLLHGFPLHKAIWAAQVPYLSARYQVVNVDLPGFGGSEPLDFTSLPSPDLMAREVLHLLDHLGIRHTAVAGHELGGFVALAMHEMAPQRVTGLALIASYAAPDGPGGSGARTALAEKVQTQGTAVVTQNLAPKLVAKGTPPDSPVLERLAAILLEAQPDGLIGGLFAMASRQDKQPWLEQVKVPAVVIMGAEELTMMKKQIAATAEGLPNATLVEVPKAGHLPMMEQPDEVNQALGEWLSAVYP